MMNLHLHPEERTTEAYDTDDQMARQMTRVKDS
jgi:hypothetical protein